MAATESSLGLLQAPRPILFLHGYVSFICACEHERLEGAVSTRSRVSTSLSFPLWLTLSHTLHVHMCVFVCVCACSWRWVEMQDKSEPIADMKSHYTHHWASLPHSVGLLPASLFQSSLTHGGW